MNQSAPDLDPATLEILANRYEQIAREAGMTLTRTAVSPITAEAKDLGFNVLDPDARNVVFSVWMPRHGTTLKHMVDSSIAAFADRGGIGEDDMVMTNDPHAGALHAPDIAVLAPVHHDGELIAWVGCATHHADIGGMTPGWAPTATESVQEGIIFPPSKLVEAGEVNEELFGLFARNVRMPDYQSIDLRAQIAANNVAKERIVEVVDAYGPGTIRQFYDELIDHGRRVALSTIADIPNGTYVHEDAIDFDDVYEVQCALTVAEDRLEFDFTGSADQAPSFVNCAYACAEANVHNIVSQVLFPDESANHGTFEPIDVIVPEGSIFACTRETPSSGGSVIAGWRVQSLVMATLSKALRDSPLSDRATAEWGGGKPTFQLSSRDRDGDYFTLNISQGMQGGGAFCWKDGELSTGLAGSPTKSMPNVESHESRFPVRFLFRRLVADSGGPGRYRGGLCGEYAIAPYNNPSPIDVLAFTIRRSVPPFGLFEGGAGTPSAIRRIERMDSDRDEAGRIYLDEVGGEVTELAARNEPFSIEAGEAIYGRPAAGGGIGDPLERDPELVERDLRLGYVTAAAARETYGYEP